MSPDDLAVTPTDPSPAPKELEHTVHRRPCTRHVSSHLNPGLELIFRGHLQASRSKFLGQLLY